MERQQKQQRLISYLRRLSTKTHIESRHLFQIYIQRLGSNKYLTDRMISHIIRFLKRDVCMTEDQLWDFLYDFSESHYRRSEETSTLEPFFH